MQIPMIVSVWDDNYGISVPSEYQTTKGDISEVLKGFKKEKNSNGFEIFKVKGWDYVELMKTYEKAEKICRSEHIPVIVHVNELTQPLRTLNIWISREVQIRRKIKMGKRL